MVMAQSCGLTSVSSSLAQLLGVKENSVRQRIREWSYAKGDKRGAGRSEIDVSSSFVALLRWVLSWWPINEKRLALAMDATSLGQVLVVLAISVVYRGCAYRLRGVFCQPPKRVPGKSLGWIYSRISKV